MSYKLEKPYTENQRLDFIVKYNHNKGMRISETEFCLYALEDDEIIDNEQPVKNKNYESEQEEILKEKTRLELLRQLDDLDKKRIRAVCEPAMKTETQSWLEYYNQRIFEIRQVMAEL